MSTSFCHIKHQRDPWQQSLVWVQKFTKIQVTVQLISIKPLSRGETLLMLTFPSAWLKFSRKRSLLIPRPSLRNRFSKNWCLKKPYSSTDSSRRVNLPAVMISCTARTRKNRNAKKKSSWRNKERQARTLAPHLRRRAGNPGLIHTRIPLARPRRSSLLISRSRRPWRRKRRKKRQNYQAYSNPYSLRILWHPSLCSSTMTALTTWSKNT